MVDVEFASWAVMDKPGVELYHVAITVRASYDEDSGQWASWCEELVVPSSGRTQVEALFNALEATVCYLNAIEALGERRRVFDERGVAVERGLPPDEHEELRVTSPEAVLRVVVAGDRQIVSAG